MDLLSVLSFHTPSTAKEPPTNHLKRDTNTYTSSLFLLYHSGTYQCSTFQWPINALMSVLLQNSIPRLHERNLQANFKCFCNIRVVATCRNPSQATELQSLASRHPEALTIVTLDLTDEASIKVCMSHMPSSCSGRELLNP